LNYQRSNWTI